jgi:glycosyltransferase involved in cell wall biosynthesis
MLLAIGILAHNEESQLGQLIGDVARQSILHNTDLSIEILLVANGCTDRTVAVAQAAFANEAFARPNIRSFVHELHESGKSNAWNHLIHKFASPQSDYIILLDADIRLPEASALMLLFESLASSNSAVVAIDESVKDLALKPSLTLVERLILKGSGTANDTRTALAGGCYCAKFSALREIWMPIGLPGEDGFLRAMILTSSFTADEDLKRLLFVPGARHIFESERRICDVFRHNVRLAIGTAINVLLFLHFRAHPRDAQALSAYIRERNRTDPKWVNTLISDQMRANRYFVMPTSMIWRRPKLFATLRFADQVSKAPILLIGFVFDLAIYLRANHLMRRGAGAGFW